MFRKQSYMIFCGACMLALVAFPQSAKGIKIAEFVITGQAAAVPANPGSLLFEIRERDGGVCGGAVIYPYVQGYDDVKGDAVNPTTAEEITAKVIQGLRLGPFLSVGTFDSDPDPETELVSIRIMSKQHFELCLGDTVPPTLIVGTTGVGAHTENSVTVTGQRKPKPGPAVSTVGAVVLVAFIIVGATWVFRRKAALSTPVA